MPVDAAKLEELRALRPSDSEKMLNLALTKCGNDVTRAAELLKRARAKYNVKKATDGARPPSTPLTRSSAGVAAAAAAAVAPRSPSSLVAAQMGTPVGRSVRVSSTAASSSSASAAATPPAVPAKYTASARAGEERALVAKDATLSGDITIGAGAVIHPHCTIEAQSGPIVIGAGTIIEELVRIVNDDPSGAALRIGSHTLVEVGSHVRGGASVGDGCHLEPRCVVGAGATLGSGCIVGATVELADGSALADNSIAFQLSSDGRSRTRALPPGDAATLLCDTERYRLLLADPRSSSCLSKFNELQ
jgi:carbonic anhydrase/acetyltransferase-like protein (isoleucine patch superfamily)